MHQKSILYSQLFQERIAEFQNQTIQKACIIMEKIEGRIQFQNNLLESYPKPEICETVKQLDSVQQIRYAYKTQLKNLKNVFKNQVSDFLQNQMRSLEFEFQKQCEEILNSYFKVKEQLSLKNIQISNLEVISLQQEILLMTLQNQIKMTQPLEKKIDHYISETQQDNQNEEQQQESNEVSKFQKQNGRKSRRNSKLCRESLIFESPKKVQIQRRVSVVYHKSNSDFNQEISLDQANKLLRKENLLLVQSHKIELEKRENEIKQLERKIEILNKLIEDLNEEIKKVQRERKSEERQYQLNNRTQNLDEIVIKNCYSTVKSRFDLQDYQKQRSQTEDCRYQLQRIQRPKSGRQDKHTSRIQTQFKRFQLKLLDFID